MDEIKIYRGALTASEVLTEFNRGSALVMGTLSTSTNSRTAESASSEYCIPGDTSTCDPPVARWDFNEKSGQTAYDSSGNGNNGTLGANSSAGSDDPSWTIGKKGAGLSFDGSNDYVIVSDSNSLDITNSITIMGWFKLNLLQNYQHILAKRQGTNCQLRL